MRFSSQVIKVYTLISSFMPAISALSGNLGLQASSNTIRGLGTGEIEPNTKKSTVCPTWMLESYILQTKTNHIPQSPRRNLSLFTGVWVSWSPLFTNILTYFRPHRPVWLPEQHAPGTEAGSTYFAEKSCLDLRKKQILRYFLLKTSSKHLFSPGPICKTSSRGRGWWPPPCSPPSSPPWPWSGASLTRTTTTFSPREISLVCKLE